jgi:hypothetical protein
LITEKQIEEAIGPIDDYWHNCHAASIAIVRSGLLGRECRVARGTCCGVGGQHSWVVRGSTPEEVYDEDTTIIDVTLWSYDETKPKVWIGTRRDGLHMPHHGQSNIWEYGCPDSGGDPEVPLTPKEPLSDLAERWLTMFREIAGGPLDRRFWAALMTHSPYAGWPSAEITKAVHDTPELRALIPIDRLGLQTDVNPGLLFLPDPEGMTDEEAFRHEVKGMTAMAQRIFVEKT